MWQSRGLPSDALSLFNGAAVAAAVRCPWILDPSSRVRLRKYLKIRPALVLKDQRWFVMWSVSHAPTAPIPNTNRRPSGCAPSLRPPPLPPLLPPATQRPRRRPPPPPKSCSCRTPDLSTSSSWPCGLARCVILLLCSRMFGTSDKHRFPANSHRFHPQPTDQPTRQALIVTEVDALEPLLYPLLRRDLARSGPRSMVQIGARADWGGCLPHVYFTPINPPIHPSILDFMPGDKSVDYHDSFRLFLLSRSPTALSDLPPAAAPLLTVANFEITRDGLEGE
jgi:hypothetical protein